MSLDLSGPGVEFFHPPPLLEKRSSGWGGVETFGDGALELCMKMIDFSRKIR